MPDAAEAVETGMIVNADGTIAFNFEGHVHATGLDLDMASGASPPNDDKIRWLRAGLPRAEIYGWHDGFYELRLHASSLLSGISVFTLGDLDGGPIGDVLQVLGGAVYSMDWFVGNNEFVIDDVGGNAILRFHPAATPFLQAEAGGFTRRIVTGTDASDFLTLVTRAATRIDFGADTLTSIPAVNSITKSIAHGLGVAPKFVGITCSNNNANVICQSAPGGTPTTSFTAQVAHRDAATTFVAGVQIPINWVAIG